MAKDKTETPAKAETPKMEERVVKLEKITMFLCRALKVFGRNTFSAIERETGVDLDRDGKIGGRARVGALVAIFVTCLTIAALGAEVIVSRWVSREGTDAVLELACDDEDDANDELQIIMNTDNDLSITIGTSEVLNLTAAGALTLPLGGIVGTGTKGTLITPVHGAATLVEYVYGNLHNVKITCTAFGWIQMDESGVTSHGGTNIYTFPEGLICTLGAVIDGSITGAGNDYMSATWDGDVALGTTEVDNTATPMATTQQDILQNTATGTAVAQVATCDAQSTATILTESGARWLDGTAGAKTMWFNTLIDESADNEDSGTNTFTGTIEFSYLLIGDN